MLNTFTDYDRGGTVVPFRHPQEDAMGRNRRLAAGAIVGRLRKLSEKAKFTMIGPWPGVDVRVGSLNIFFSRTTYGLYFRIDGVRARSPLMTGYVDPVRPGTYPELSLHVMSWRRGWEGELF